MDEDKAAWRRSLLTTRRSLSPADWQTRSQQLAQRLQTVEWFQQAHTILSYASVRQEPDLSSLFPLAKQWGLPRCVGRSLVWHRWHPADSLPLQSGAFGILEPAPELPTLTADQVDLLLVPAVGCDRHGYRLGYGGGFYDRLLSLPEWQAKPTIGIVFDFALVPELPHDPWDCPLNAVCTEQELWICDRG